MIEGKARLNVKRGTLIIEGKFHLHDSGFVKVAQVYRMEVQSKIPASVDKYESLEGSFVPRERFDEIDPTVDVTVNGG